MKKSQSGLVYIVGAGPGDPGLLTLKACRTLASAEVVVYDRLINTEILSHAPESADLIYVGKSTEQHVYSQDAINALLAEKARENKIVVRLKGGDPFVFGRGGEEITYLSRQGIDFEYVPGITSAVAVPGYAGIPVTHRECSPGVSFITGHRKDGNDLSAIDWGRLAGMPGTLVFVMGVQNLKGIVHRLVACGKPDSTPAALIRNGTTPFQCTIEADLGSIVGAAAENRCSPPAILIVGEVVALRKTMQWFETKPLFGKTVLITRPKHQSQPAADMVRALGGEPVLMPVIEIKPVYDKTVVKNTVQSLHDYDWVVFTSENAVELFFKACSDEGKDARIFAKSRVCAIGPKTAATIQAHGIKPDCVPERYCAEGIIDALGHHIAEGQKILLPRARGARDVLIKDFCSRGAHVDEIPLYEAIRIPFSAEDYMSNPFSNQIDYILFTSSSTVRSFVDIVYPELIEKIKRTAVAACIGPITAETARGCGFPDIIESEEYTIAGLVSTIVEHAGGFIKGYTQ